MALSCLVASSNSSSLFLHAVSRMQKCRKSQAAARQPKAVLGTVFRPSHTAGGSSSLRRGLRDESLHYIMRSVTVCSGLRGSPQKRTANAKLRRTSKAPFGQGQDLVRKLLVLGEDQRLTCVQAPGAPQKLQHPLIQEYALKYSRIPNMI